MIRAWRHRDGGFVLQISGETWTLETCLARRRRDQYGLGKPFSVMLTTGMRGDLVPTERPRPPRPAPDRYGA